MVRKDKLKSEQMHRKVTRMNGENGETSDGRSLKAFRFQSLGKKYFVKELCGWFICYTHMI